MQTWGLIVLGVPQGPRSAHTQPGLLLRLNSFKNQNIAHPTPTAPSLASVSFANSINEQVSSADFTLGMTS